MNDIATKCKMSFIHQIELHQINKAYVICVAIELILFSLLIIAANSDQI